MNFDYNLETITPENTGTITINGFLETYISSGVAAAGITQGAATAIIANTSIVTSATAGSATGILLPVPTGGLTAGLFVTVVNRTTVTLSIWPNSGAAIDLLSTNTAISLPPLSCITLQASSSTQWYTADGIATVAGTANGGVGTITFVTSNPAAGNLNNLYINTTSDLIYWDNGTSLVQLAQSSGGGATITPTTTSNTYYPIFTSSTSGTLTVADINTTSGAFSYNANTGVLSATSFTGAGTGLTGTASSLTVGTASNIANGTANQIPYQTNANTTSFFSAANYGVLIYGSTGVPTSLAGAAGVLVGSASAIPTFSNTPTLSILTLTSAFNFAVTNSISAAGTTQGTATALTTSVNNVTTAAASSGVILPIATVGQTVIVYNNGANTLNVYPQSSSSIDGAAANTPATIAAGGQAMYIAITTTAWYTARPSLFPGSGISITQGTGIQTITNTGVTSIAGTAGQIIASASTGASTLSLAAPAASITAATAGLNTTETVLVKIQIPTAPAAGDSYEFICYGACTTTVANVSTFTVRYGSTGTTSDSSLGTITSTSGTTGSAVKFRVTIVTTFWTTSTAVVSGEITNNNTTGIANQLPTISAATTGTSFTGASNDYLSITYKSAATTTTSTFYSAVVYKLR